MTKRRTITAEAWRPPQRRWREADGEDMVAALKASGLSQRAFASRHGLPAHRVSYWCSRIRAAGGGAETSAFLPVVVAETPEPVAADRCVEVRLRSGRSLVLHGEWDAGAIAPWLRALEVLS
jgi:transposase-like protein